jgi:hypothetical protein
MVLKRMFGPKKDDVTGEWRKLHFEEPVVFCTPKGLLFGWSHKET